MECGLGTPFWKMISQNWCTYAHNRTHVYREGVKDIDRYCHSSPRILSRWIDTDTRWISVHSPEPPIRIRISTNSYWIVFWDRYWSGLCLNSTLCDFSSWSLYLGLLPGRTLSIHVYFLCPYPLTLIFYYQNLCLAFFFIENPITETRTQFPAFLVPVKV